jgi:choline dehydrogenase
MSDSKKGPGDTLTRRELEKLGLAAGVSLLTGCPSPSQVRPAPIEVSCKPAGHVEVDYVVVGSGAAGGPLACNLARAGFKVMLLEAGGDPTSWTREVPALHAEAVEDPEMRWDFFVRTYADDAQQRHNEKFVKRENGVLYPRAGTLGGCTAHNALITICPHNRDWDEIAATFGDPSWSADSMRKYFERLEHCDYAPRPSGGAGGAARHGFDGWLHTNVANPWIAIKDARLRAIIEAAVAEAGRIDAHLLADAVRMLLSRDQALWDPNDWRMVSAAHEGMVFVPLHVNNGQRTSTRDYVRATAAACPNNLVVELHALAGRVVLDESRRATGVEYLKGRSLYRASANPDHRPEAGERRTVHARREVILCGGVFNSPQLLLLSGIGPRAELAQHGIEARVDLPGVGKNLQDRYEIGVVSEMAGDFAVLEGARLSPPDPLTPDPIMRDWWFERKGPYATNGVVGAVIRRSKPALPVPDLFLFGLVGKFKGYYPGYSRDLSADHHHFTWGVLKAHTHNTAGEVRLRSADPRDRPEIDFHYFKEGSPGSDEDLQAVVEGVLTVRRIMAGAGAAVRREILPGPEVRTREEIARFVRDHAWGHHASCSNKMGPKSDPLAVVDQRFRVHGTTGLRVVDASIFPKIPGFFIVTSVYMVAEKASDVILEDARGGGATVLDRSP